SSSGGLPRPGPQVPPSPAASGPEPAPLVAGTVLASLGAVGHPDGEEFGPGVVVPEDVQVVRVGAILTELHAHRPLRLRVGHLWAVGLASGWAAVLARRRCLGRASAQPAQQGPEQALEPPSA